MANSPCPETIPFYYPLTLHIIAGVSIPVNLVGFYLVWYQSPKMQGYKYCLCYLQFVSFITEIHMSWICPGYYFFPMIGGYNTGAEFISSHLSMTLYVLIFAFELPSALLCFVFRHNAAQRINQNGASQMYFKKFLLILCHLFPFAASFSMWMSRLTYQQKYDFVKDNWSQCLFWMRFEAFEVYDYKLNPWLAVVGIGALLFVLIVYTYGLSLGIHTMSILQKFRKSMSKQTFQMHKTALFSLVMQLLIPGVLIIIPLGVCMTVVITGAVGLQELATNTMFLVSSHSMCSCFVMISSNPRYRTVVKEKFEKKEWDETFKFSGTESTKNK
uniref:Serpentine Receptor, class I n=1 Tax=Caenorhabditis tropicalis TaxID=1561998 RepID=A0A1I7UGZ1_9PELO